MVGNMRDVVNCLGAGGVRFNSKWQQGTGSQTHSCPLVF